MINYRNIIAETNSKHYNVHDKYKDNTVEQNVEIQKSQSRKFSVGMINVTGDLNIGMALRSACLFGAENFYIFGRKKFDKRSTVGAEKYINVIQYVYDNPMTADDKMARDIQELQDTKHSLYVCEQGGAELGSNAMWGEMCYNPLFLFGSESHGVPQKVLELVPPVSRVSIPQVGVLRSFNVSAAMNIICWDFCKESYL